MRDTQKSAEISPCGRYRWWLRRSWRRAWLPHLAGPDQPASKGVCTFVMLNPSTADGLEDDPTIRRCIAFADSWGYDTLSVRNLFPWRATEPKDLLKAHNPAGEHRGDGELLTACTGDLLVLAWGAWVPYRRDHEAFALFAEHFPGVPLFCLGTTKSGAPRHPLYVKADTQPQSFANPLLQSIPS